MRESVSVTLGHEPRRLAVGRHGTDAAGARGHERRAGRHDFQHRVRQPVDVAGLIVDRGGDGDIRRGQAASVSPCCGTTPIRRTMWATPAASARARRAPSRSPSPAMTTLQRGIVTSENRGRVNQVPETLLLHQASEGDDERHVAREAEHGPTFDPRRLIGLEPVRVHAVRHHRTTLEPGAHADRAIAQVVAARCHPGGAPECRLGSPTRETVALGDEDVGAVQADDERPGAGCGRADHTARNDPVRVHDRCPRVPHDLSGAMPSRDERERRRRRAPRAQADVGAQAPRRSRRRSDWARVRIGTDGSGRRLRIASPPLWVPRRDHVDVVTARGRSRRDRLHEGRDRIPGNRGYEVVTIVMVIAAASLCAGTMTEVDSGAATTRILPRGRMWALARRLPMTIQRIVVCEAQVPFVRGGAEYLVRSLVTELRERGYDTELVSLPFKWYPKDELLAHAAAWRLIDLSESNGRSIDLVIATEVPDVFRPASEQGHLADAPVSRRVRAVRHAVQRVHAHRRRRRPARDADAARPRDAAGMPAGLHHLAEHRGPAREVQRSRGRAALSAVALHRPARGRGRTATTCCWSAGSSRSSAPIWPSGRWLTSIARFAW